MDVNLIGLHCVVEVREPNLHITFGRIHSFGPSDREVIRQVWAPP